MQPGHAAGADVGSGAVLKCSIVNIKGARGPAGSTEGCSSRGYCHSMKQRDHVA